MSSVDHLPVEKLTGRAKAWRKIAFAKRGVALGGDRNRKQPPVSLGGPKWSHPKQDQQ